MTKIAGRIILLLLIFGASEFSVSAQRYVHLNFGSLIAEMPEAKRADAELEKYQNDLIGQVENMAKTLQADIKVFGEKVQNGQLTPRQQQEQEKNLQERQQQVQTLGQELPKKVEQKRDQLLKPIVEKANRTIETAARENGIQFVFDTSVFNAVLHAEDSFDLAPLVRSKLGLPPRGTFENSTESPNLAFVNSASILAELPEVKSADGQFEALERQLKKKHQDMLARFQADYAEIQRKVDNGELSPLQQEEEDQKLTTRQAEIAQFEKDMVKQLEDRRTGLLTPVYEKVNRAITSAARTNNVQFVFDQGVLLYADENLDLTRPVYQRLGGPAAAAFQTSAPKTGFVNPSATLAYYPLLEEAQNQLEAHQKQLQKKGQDMVDQLKADYVIIQDKIEKGVLSPYQQKEESKKLEKRKAETAQFEKDMVKQLEDKRAELLTPIYTKVNEAIAAAAREKGVQFVFDQGVLLHADPALDLGSAVRRKLGI
jgi:outer membrane protein